MLSAVEMSRTTQTVLALAWSLLSAIIRTHIHVPCILAAATIRGRHLFHSVLPIMRLLFLMAVIIQGWSLFKEIRYSHVYVVFLLVFSFCDSKLCMHTW